MCQSKDKYTDRVAEFITSLRKDADISREKLAHDASFSVATLKRWENGETVPSIAQLMEIVDITGENLDYAMLKFRHPEMYDISTKSDDTEVDAAFDEYLKTITTREKRHILFAVSSCHGGDRHALMELVSAYLQIPMAARYAIAQLIETQYNLSVANHAVQCPHNIQPDVDLLHAAIEGGRDAALSGLTGYSL